MAHIPRHPSVGRQARKARRRPAGVSRPTAAAFAVGLLVVAGWPPSVQADETQDAQKWRDGPPAVLKPLGENLRIKAGAPSRAWISDRYEVSVLVANQDLVPHLVSVDVVPKTSDVCSVASYGTSSSATQLRPNEYLLDGNGTQAVGGLFGGDSVSAGVAIKPAAVGSCEILIQVTMDALFQKTATVVTSIELPPSFAHLGSLVVASSDCGGALAKQGLGPVSLTVPADEPVDLVAALEYDEPCNDDNAVGGVVIQRQLPDGSWVTTGASLMSVPGESEVRSASKQSFPLGKTPVRAVAFGLTSLKVSWECILTVLGIIAGAAALAAAYGVVATAIAGILLGLGLLVPPLALIVALAVLAIVIISVGVYCLGWSDVIELPFDVTGVSSASPTAVLR